MSLSSPVCRIFWDIVDGNSENKVLVVTQAGASYLADHVILTPSIGHLKERHASLFTPALPDSYQAAMAVGTGQCRARRREERGRKARRGEEMRGMRGKGEGGEG